MKSFLAGHMPDVPRPRVEPSIDPPSPAPGPTLTPPPPYEKYPKRYARPWRKVLSYERQGARWAYTLECTHVVRMMSHPRRVTGYKCRVCLLEFLEKNPEAEEGALNYDTDRRRGGPET
jgi:hypothetical protein